MRTKLVEDLRFAPHNPWIELLELLEVPPPLEASDLWFRMMDAEVIGTTEIWVYRTRKEAIAETPGPTWVAHAVIPQIEAQSQEASLPGPVATPGTMLRLSLYCQGRVTWPGVLWVSLTPAKSAVGWGDFGQKGR